MPQIAMGVIGPSIGPVLTAHPPTQVNVSDLAGFTPVQPRRTGHVCGLGLEHLQLIQSKIIHIPTKKKKVLA